MLRKPFSNSVSNSQLFIKRMLSIADCQKIPIGSRWVHLDERKTFNVHNPATGEVIGRMPEVTADDVEKAINSAASSSWPKFTPVDRSRLLRKWYDLIIQNAESIAQILHQENGKTIVEARGEVNYAASFVEWFAEESRRTYGETHPPVAPNKRIFVSREPVGVCALITPWNFPAAMITRKQAAALAAGCTTVTKPSELTPFTAVALAILAEQAGIPLDAVSLLTTTHAKAVGDQLCDSQVVRKVSFTGSTAVGKYLLSRCGNTVKRTSMELGGNAPLIVFQDADLDNAVSQTISAKFRGSGQTCVCANRIFVHESIFDEFAARLSAKMATLDMGPLCSSAQLKKVSHLLKDATDKGAKVISGGDLSALSGQKGFFFPATIIDARPLINTDASIIHEEIFGPIAALQSFATEKEVLDRANSSEGGLAAYIFTQDLSRSLRISEAIQTGMVGVNTGAISHAEAPFGGVKESGLGREGSKYGIEEYMNIKYVCMQFEP